MNQELLEHYGVHVSQLSALGGYQSFWVRNKIYLLVPVGAFQEEELVEMKQLSDYMNESGDMSVAAFVPNLQGYYVSEIQNVSYCLLRAMRQPDRQASLGKELAIFHRRGRMYPDEITSVSRIGEWKGLWEKRLDQLEKFWQTRIANHPTTTFEKLFIDSFPYYLGLAENAIQYVVDTELDGEPLLVDAATICQQRFTAGQWQQTKHIKIPVDWVFDHASRDLAECIRHMQESGGDDANTMILDFLRDYESEGPLSAFGWRLLFARLLFPLQYFETVENYYLSGTEEQKNMYQDRLQHITASVRQSERFLASFYHHIHLPIEKLGIRGVDWLRE